MKYTVEILIDKPKEETVKLYNNIDNLYQWMEGLQSIELLEGKEGEKGAKSKLIFKNSKRELEMIETILVNDLPDKMVTTYDAKGVNNIIFTEFHSEGDKTRYVAHQEFKMHGFMKVIGFLFPKSFKKQSLKYMEDFKNFAESN